MDNDTRTRLYEEFATRFGADGMHGPATPFSHADVGRIETALDKRLPDSYVQFVTERGALFVPDLWDAIADDETINIHPVREFMSSAEVVNDTKLYWTAGMPADFIGIAGDMMGNMFGFVRSPPEAGKLDDAPVLLWDHDYVRVSPVADSFDAWLRLLMDAVQPNSNPASA